MHALSPTSLSPAIQLHLALALAALVLGPLALRARNLLDPVIESRQGDEVVRAFRRGRMVGLSLGAVF